MTCIDNDKTLCIYMTKEQWNKKKYEDTSNIFIILTPDEYRHVSGTLKSLDKKREADRQYRLKIKEKIKSIKDEK